MLLFQHSRLYYLVILMVVSEVELTPLSKSRTGSANGVPIDQDDTTFKIVDAEEKEINTIDLKQKSNVTTENKTESSTNLPISEESVHPEVGSMTITSQTITVNETEPTLSIENQSHEKNETDAILKQTLSSENSIAVSNGENLANLDNETETDTSYKDIVRPSFQPYIEEILQSEEITNDTDAPSRIKTIGFEQSPLNTLMTYPNDGRLPSFSEQEMNKLRLNYWRVKQILKEDQTLQKTGHPATFIPNPELVLNLNHRPQPNPFGQKRSASVLSTYQNDDMVSFLTSADAIGDDEKTAEDSKLRTFFSWFQKKPSEDEIRLEHAKAQQAVLPFALGYNGDFVFW